MPTAPRPRQGENPTLERVVQQFQDRTAQDELRSMGPQGVDWAARTKQTLDALLPRLPKVASDLAREVPATLNAAGRVRTLVGQGRKFVDSLGGQQRDVRAWYDELRSTADLAHAVIGHLESQQVSSAIQRFVISSAGLGDLVTRSGNSIYPDLVMKTRDYTMLPRQSRKSPVDGPCLRGTNPSNVPDGCEIKTNQGARVKVDAHGAHPGLHLGVTWDFENEAVTITGVWVAYIRIADHRESGRNVDVTTVKYSFGHDLFSSLL